MAVRDHGIEVLKKSGEEVTPGNKSDYYIKVNDADNGVILSAILAALGGSADTTAKVDNEPIAAANTEQSFALPANTKSFLIRNRSLNDLRFSYTANGTNTEWLTIRRGATFKDINFYSSQTVYFQSPGVGDVIEITTYI